MIHFLIIGAQRCGTTWLFANLKEHPDIFMPNIKELHYWDNSFPESSILAYLQFFMESGNKKSGEATPSYAELPIWKIREIHKFNPKLRLLFLIRNPMQRAWSHATHVARYNNLNPLELSDDFFIKRFQDSQSLNRGDYEQCLVHWLAFFPREQLKILRYDSISTEPKKVVRQALEHIQVDNTTWFDPKKIHQVRVIYGVDLGDKREYPKIRESLVPFLQEIYFPRIDSLSKFLDEDFSEWKT